MTAEILRPAVVQLLYDRLTANRRWKRDKGFVEIEAAVNRELRVSGQPRLTMAETDLAFERVIADYHRLPGRGLCDPW